MFWLCARVWTGGWEPVGEHASGPPTDPVKSNLCYTWIVLMWFFSMTNVQQEAQEQEQPVIYFGIMALRRLFEEPFQHLTKQDNQKLNSLPLRDKRWENCSNRETLNLRLRKNTINVWSYRDKKICLLLRSSQTLVCPALTQLLHTCCSLRQEVMSRVDRQEGTWPEISKYLAAFMCFLD